MKKETRVIHDDCYGGEMKWKIELNSWKFNSWKFICQRCGTVMKVDEIYGVNEGKIGVISTAIDGEERKISCRGGIVVRIIQKS